MITPTRTEDRPEPPKNAAAPGARVLCYSVIADFVNMFLRAVGQSEVRIRVLKKIPVIISGKIENPSLP